MDQYSGNRKLQGHRQPLYLPGTILVGVVLITYVMHKMKIYELKTAFSESR